MSEAVALLTGLDTLPATAATPSGNPAESGFAGMLTECRSAASARSAQAQTTPPGAGLPADDTGDGSPQMGKPLPLGIAVGEGGEAATAIESLLSLGDTATAAPETDPALLPALPPTGQGGAPLAIGVPPAQSLESAPQPVGTQAAPVAAAAPAVPTNTGQAAPAQPVSAAAPVVASGTSAAPAEIIPLTAPPATEMPTEAAVPLPNWSALRLAKAGGIAPRPGVNPSPSLNKEPAGDAKGQDFLQLLGIRPATVSAPAMASPFENGRPLMTAMPQPSTAGEVPVSDISTLSGDGDITATGILSPSARSAATIASPTVSVAAPVGQGNWSQEMGQRVMWLANLEIRSAQIQLNPQHLGPVEVRIAYGQEQQLSVSFVAHHPQAREAIDAMLPRLRDMFDGQGLNLANVSVSQESFAERRRGPYENAAKGQARGGGGNGIAMEGLDATPPPTLRAVGLFDAYA